MIDDKITRVDMGKAFNTWLKEQPDAITDLRQRVAFANELTGGYDNRGNHVLGAFLTGVLQEYDTLRAERDGLLKVYEAAEDFIGAQGTAYEDDQYLMLCGVVGTYNLKNTNAK
jgi:hypothetical protein